MERLKGWVSKLGTPVRFFKFKQEPGDGHVYVEEIPEGSVTIYAEIGAYVTWAGESDNRDYGHLAITDERLNNLVGKKVRVIIMESDE